MKYTIYQIKRGSDYSKFMFREWNEVSTEFNFSNYEMTYEGEFDDSEVLVDDDDNYDPYLDEIFHICNVCHPKDYKGHSLSVSDIVKIDNKYFFCDSYGWKEITWRITPKTIELTIDNILKINELRRAFCLYCFKNNIECEKAGEPNDKLRNTWYEMLGDYINKCWDNTSIDEIRKMTGYKFSLENE